MLLLCGLYRATRSPEHIRPKQIILAGSGYSFCLSLVGVYYAGEFGLIPPRDVVPFSFVMAIMIPLSTWLAFKFRKWFND
jgi:hypothetical protein